MNRFAFTLLAGMAATACFASPSMAKGSAGGSVIVAPVSNQDPDVVAIGSVGSGSQSRNSAPSPAGTSTVSASFRTVSPSVIAEIGSALPDSAKPVKARGKHRFDPGLMVIRAGLMGNASKIRQSATSPTQAGQGKSPTGVNNPAAGMKRD